MNVYTAFYLINFAETWRDPDDIRRTDIGTFKTLEGAKEAVFKEINWYFLKYKTGTIKTPKWHKCIDERYSNSIYHSETGSWAPTYIIQTVNVK